MYKFIILFKKYNKHDAINESHNSYTLEKLMYQDKEKEPSLSNISNFIMAHIHNQFDILSISPFKE